MPMKKQPMQSATSLPPSPDEERRSRVIKYSITMSVRVVCFLVIFIVPGWWKLIPILGTIVLPYIAVVLANTASRVTSTVMERPGDLMLDRPVTKVGSDE